MSRLTTSTAQSNAHLQRGGIRLALRGDQLRKKIEHQQAMAWLHYAEELGFSLSELNVVILVPATAAWNTHSR